jgi:hypothetical protein
LLRHAGPVFFREYPECKNICFIIILVTLIGW